MEGSIVSQLPKCFAYIAQTFFPKPWDFSIRQSYQSVSESMGKTIRIRPDYSDSVTIKDCEHFEPLEVNYYPWIVLL